MLPSSRSTQEMIFISEWWNPADRYCRYPTTNYNIAAQLVRQILFESHYRKTSIFAKKKWHVLEVGGLCQDVSIHHRPRGASERGILFEDFEMKKRGWNIEILFCLEYAGIKQWWLWGNSLLYKSALFGLVIYWPLICGDIWADCFLAPTFLKSVSTTLWKKDLWLMSEGRWR